MRTGHPCPGLPTAASTARRGRPPVLRALLVALLAIVATAGPTVGVAGAATFDDLYADYRRAQTIDACKYSATELRSAKRRIGSDAAQYAPEFPAALDRAIAGRGACKTDAASTSGTATGAGSTQGGTDGGAAAGGDTGSAGGATADTAAGDAAATPGLPTVTTTPGQAPAPGPTTPAAPAATPTTPAPAAAGTPAPAAQDGAVVAAAETPARDDGPEAWTWAVLAGAIVLAALLGWALVNATGRIGWLAPVGHSMGEAGWRISLRWAEFRDWLRFGSGR